MHTLDLLDRVDGDDVRVIERRQCLGLALEPPQSLLRARQLSREYLERHLPLELGVLGAIDLSHTAFTELGGDPEIRQRLADQVGVIVTRWRIEVLR